MCVLSVCDVVVVCVYVFVCVCVCTCVCVCVCAFTSFRGSTMLEKLLARLGGIHAWSIVVAVAGVAWVVYRSRHTGGRKLVENSVSRLYL